MIFISYRRDDADIVRALQVALESELGTSSVVRDRTSIRGGDDLRDAISRGIDDAEVVLVVIGPTWDGVDDSGTRRLQQADDWVRFEVSLALAWRKQVVPLLLDSASMPSRKSLPGDLSELADRAALALRDSDWERDIETLLEVIAPGRSAGPDARTAVIDAGPVAGGNIVIKGDIVAGRDLGPNADGSGDRRSRDQR